LSLTRLASSGTDNVIFRVGDELALRLPRIRWAVPQIAKELEWLPKLAPQLPIAVPQPVALGQPDLGYPYPWLVYRWVNGHDALRAPPDWRRIAPAVARFVSALHRADSAGAPAAGGRGGALMAYDGPVRDAIAQLGTVIDVVQAREVWQAALSAEPWTQPPVWVHGDLLPGNVIARGAEVTAIIDWSAAGIGDPACDCMLAWAMPADARQRYRAELGVDDDTWARGRGWALHQAVFFIPYYADTIPDAVAAATQRLRAVLAADARDG
jgi:aminoglycoside phosphotransferase (APT) family kinase protein